MKRGFRFVAAWCLVAALSAAAEAGEYTVTRWRSSAKGCGRGAKGAVVTVTYRGSGSRILSTGCVTAVFEDGSQCPAVGYSFDNVRISASSRGVTRPVCFCGSRSKIADVVYACREPF